MFCGNSLTRLTEQLKTHAHLYQPISAEEARRRSQATGESISDIGEEEAEEPEVAYMSPIAAGVG